MFPGPASQDRKIESPLQTVQREGRCLLWVISGHRRRTFECPLCLRKRTSQRTVVMSAKCHLRPFASQHDHCGWSATSRRMLQMGH